jgi:hypothetical protein
LVIKNEGEKIPLRSDAIEREDNFIVSQGFVGYD